MKVHSSRATFTVREREDVYPNNRRPADDRAGCDVKQMAKAAYEVDAFKPNLTRAEADRRIAAPIAATEFFLHGGLESGLVGGTDDEAWQVHGSRYRLNAVLVRQTCTLQSANQSLTWLSTSSASLPRKVLTFIADLRSARQG